MRVIEFFLLKVSLPTVKKENSLSLRERAGVRGIQKVASLKFPSS
jgi:hypothetical protein